MRFKIKKKEVLFMIINIFIKLMYLNIIKKRIYIIIIFFVINKYIQI